MDSTAAKVGVVAKWSYDWEATLLHTQPPARQSWSEFKTLLTWALELREDLRTFKQMAHHFQIGFDTADKTGALQPEPELRPKPPTRPNKVTKSSVNNVWQMEDLNDKTC